MGAENYGALGIYAAAFVLGAMHSIEPGHGKTVVAAYLAGTSGRNRDAILLGLVVTLTHSFGIIVLGVIAKASSSYFSEQALHAYLGLFASFIILGIGIWMLKTRWTALKDPSKAHHHSHLFHSHDHGTEPHDHHHHDHDHNDHNHDYHHQSHINPAGSGGLGVKGLVLLGITGGIVPCPAALAILLASASMGDIGKGLALVIIFSLGLAFSLVAIGLVVVNGVGFAQRFINTERFAPVAAFVSAVIITIVGLGAFVTSWRHLA